MDKGECVGFNKLMYSLNYYLSKTPGLRRLLKWSTQKKINTFKSQEELRIKTDSRNLRNFEDKVFSQNGEDGIIREIFKRIGTTNKFFVEFGVENGQECNGRYLLESCKWSGVWIDGSLDNVKQAKDKFNKYPIEVLDRFITKENILEIFSQAKVPKDLDLLSIDIDGNDYWVWEELREYKARVVVIEYNSKYLPHEDWTMPYNPKHIYDGSSYFGASLLSLKKLGEKLGYKLVSCDNMGVNAFFVREDLLGDQFTHVEDDVSYHYCCPKYKNLFFGHPSGSGKWR